MDKVKEEQVLESFLDLENKKLALLVINFYKDITGIRSDMVGDLNLLDQTAEGRKDSREMLRKSILDNYNELPRKTLEFLEELINKIEE